MTQNEINSLKLEYIEHAMSIVKDCATKDRKLSHRKNIDKCYELALENLNMKKASEEIKIKNFNLMRSYCE